MSLSEAAGEGLQAQALELGGGQEHATYARRTGRLTILLAHFGNGHRVLANTLSSFCRFLHF